MLFDGSCGNLGIIRAVSKVNSRVLAKYQSVQIYVQVAALRWKRTVVSGMQPQISAEQQC